MASTVVDGLVIPVSLAGHPVLDFCNTRAAWTAPVPKEYLRSHAHLTVWAGANGLVPPAEVAGLRRAGERSAGAGMAVVDRAVRFRSALYALLVRPLFAVVWAAARFLTTPAARAVDACPSHDCGWLFPNPTGRRRWCSMALCGNRAKAGRPGNLPGMLQTYDERNRHVPSWSWLACAITLATTASTWLGSMPSRWPMCVAQTSDRRLASKSSWLRTSVRIAWRFWLTITNVDRKIASRLTIMVSRPNGYRSNISAAPTRPRLSTIQPPNHTECR